jgi:hypothetical protein
MSMIEVSIEYERNGSRITIRKEELTPGGITNIEDQIRRMTDQAKTEFIAALKARV